VKALELVELVLELVVLGEGVRVLALPLLLLGLEEGLELVVLVMVLALVFHSSLS
jgi:hypothetical protein